MAQCCLNCFTDRAIIELIQREGNITRCSFCDSDEVLCVTPDKLTGLFELVLGCIVEDALGDEIQNVYVDELKIVCKKTYADQFLLFDEAELCTDPQVEQHEKDNQYQSKSNASISKPRGRKPLSSDLPREQIFLYLKDEQKAPSLPK